MSFAFSSNQNEKIDSESIRRLLWAVSPNREFEVDALFDELKPQFVINGLSEKIAFSARPGLPNVITIGLRQSIRLQAHAYAAAVIINAIGQPNFASMQKSERDLLFSPADALLTLAVGADMAGWLEPWGLKLKFKDVLESEQSWFRSVGLKPLTRSQLTIGEGLFRYACAWIILHELAHLKLGHSYTEGDRSFEQEKEADRFAAEWMLNAASFSSRDVDIERLTAIFGIAIALVWHTVFDVYFGRSQSKTHPQGYDRLSQVLDQIIDWPIAVEHSQAWYFVSTLLFIHMVSAGYVFDARDAVHMQGNPRDEVNYLIDRISRSDWSR